MKKILLVGGGGFVGRHLYDELAKRGHQVFAADLPETTLRNRNILPLDLRDIVSIQKVLEQVRPEVVFHLAAQSMVTLSWEKPAMTFDINVTGAVNMFMETAQTLPECRFIFIGSGEEYGIGCDMAHPFTEETFCKPQNPYAISKFSAGMLLKKSADRMGTDFIHLRPFNHYGPGQRTGFAVSDFCSQIAAIEAGMQPPEMQIGCLTAQRDFLFIQDVINAYCLFAECREHRHSIYNICSGIAYPIQHILDILTSFSSKKIKITIDPTRFRQPVNPALYASAERLKDEFNWKNQTSLSDGLLKTLNYWRENTVIK